ncbi:response regulator transcription factor [soil metagenome]
MDPIRVLVADDHTFYREGVRTMLDAVPNINVVGEAVDGHMAVEATMRLQPDVVLMDLMMPEINGIEATRRVLQESPHVGVLVVTMLDDDDSVFAAMRAGARGYLLKDATLDEAIRAIIAIHNGEAIFSPSIAQRMMQYFSHGHATGLASAFPELTGREYEILTLIAQRRTNPEIADRLFLSPKTVRNHVSNIFSKLQVADRAQAIIRAREAGLGRINTTE